MGSRKRVASLAGILVLVAGVVSGSTSLAEPSHEHHQHPQSGQSGDAHAAHRAAMKQNDYSVTVESYPMPDVRLLDTDGTPVALSSILDSDKPVALNFIFTTCTTICPVMTATFAQMQRQLGDAAGQLELVSISIDPEYDRPEILKAYARQFGAGSNWTFLTGDSLDVEKVLRDFDTYAGSKMNHQPVTFLRCPGDPDWIRIDGLASADDLAREVSDRLLN